MNTSAHPLLLVMYSGITAGTILLMTILVKYLKEKALQKQHIRDQVLSDLAIISGGFVVTIAVLALTRELVGPFQNPTLVSTLFMFLQYFYTTMLSCIVSLQITQVFSVIYAAAMSEWNEETLVLFHRLFVIALGFSTGGLVCFLRGGMCRPTPFYNYILQEYKDEDSLDTIIQSLMLLLFVIVIVLSQAVLEIKRFMLRRAEMKVDVLAVSALKQMEEAAKKLRRKPPLQLGGHSLLEQAAELAEVDLPSTESDINKGPLLANQNRSTQNENGPDSNKSSNKQSLKIARVVCVYGVLPALLTIFNISFVNAPGYRPHGSSGSFLIVYGIIIPWSLIVSNPKIKSFAKEFLYRNTIGLIK
jgi:hypothetical protein